MLALSFGLLLVMGTVALLLADMERKRRSIVDLINQLLPLVARSRRLAMANLRRLSGSPVQAYSLIDPLEREIGLVENEHDITPPGDDARRTSLFAGTWLAYLEERVQVFVDVIAAAEEKNHPAPDSSGDASVSAQS